MGEEEEEKRKSEDAVQRMKAFVGRRDDGHYEISQVDLSSLGLEFPLRMVQFLIEAGWLSQRLDGFLTTGD